MRVSSPGRPEALQALVTARERMEEHSHRAAVSQQQQMAVALSQQELEHKEALSQKEQAHVRPRLTSPTVPRLS